MAHPLEHLADKYDLLEKLGEGGMGTVFKVRHRLLDEIRVIKMMRASLREDESLSARFLQEARVAIQLRHPHIAQIFDFTLDEEKNAFIVMEHIEGWTLEALLRKIGAFPIALTLEVASQTLEALEYLHRRSFVHRDISPDNLMISRDVEHRLQVKLIDLGIAKVLGGEGRMTATGLFLGKVRYSSPEQLEGSGVSQIDGRSDLYSLGVVLYELLTGCYPISGSSPPSWIAGHLYRPPLAFEKSDPEGRVPEELRRIIMRALAKSPEERPCDAAELNDDLRAIGKSFPLSEEVREKTLGLITRERGSSSAKEASGRQTHSLDPAAPRVTTPAPWRLDTAMAPRTPPPAGPGTPTSVLEQIEKRVRRQTAERQRREVIAATAERIEEEARAGNLTQAEELLSEAVATYGDIEVWTTPRALLVEARARQMAEKAASLLHEASRLMRSEDYEAAGERVREALDIQPESTAARLLREEIRAARERQRLERRRGEAAAQVELCLDRDQLDEAERLLEHFEGEFGDPPPLADLRNRLERLRLEARADALLAEARALLRSDQLEAAQKRLEEALRNVPDRSEIRALLDETRSELRRREEERRKAAEIARVAARAAQLLDDGRLAEAAAVLGEGERGWGRQEAFQVLRERLTRLEREKRSRELVQEAQDLVEQKRFEEALQKLELARAAASDKAEVKRRIAAVKQAHRSYQIEQERARKVKEARAEVRSLLDAGELGEAERKLARAFKKLGKEAELQTLQAQLEKLQEEKRKRQLTMRETVVVDLPRGAPVDATVQAGIDRTVHLPESELPDAVESPARVEANPPGRKRGRTAFAAFLLVIVIGAVLWWRLSDEEKVGSAPAPVGVLVLRAIPWGRVVEISDAEGKAYPEAAGSYTPVAVELPPGPYRIRLTYDPLAQPRVVDVEVPANDTARYLVRFTEVSIDAFFEQMGF